MKTLEELGISPAPWTADVDKSCGFRTDFVTAINNDMVCTMSYLRGPGRKSEEERAANAYLCAAAPDLYQALASLLHCAEAPFTKESGMSVAMDMARKALAKAEGTK